MHPPYYRGCWHGALVSRFFLFSYLIPIVALLLSATLLLVFAASSMRHWAICAPAASLRSGGHLSCPLSRIKPLFSVCVILNLVPYTKFKVIHESQMRGRWLPSLYWHIHSFNACQQTFVLLKDFLSLSTTFSPSFFFPLLLSLLPICCRTAYSYICMA